MGYSKAPSLVWKPPKGVIKYHVQNLKQQQLLAALPEDKQREFDEKQQEVIGQFRAALPEDKRREFDESQQQVIASLLTSSLGDQDFTKFDMEAQRDLAEYLGVLTESEAPSDLTEYLGGDQSDQPLSKSARK